MGSVKFGWFVRIFVKCFSISVWCFFSCISSFNCFLFFVVFWFFFDKLVFKSLSVVFGGKSFSFIFLNFLMLIWEVEIILIFDENGIWSSFLVSVLFRLFNIRIIFFESFFKWFNKCCKWMVFFFVVVIFSFKVVSKLVLFKRVWLIFFW